MNKIQVSYGVLINLLFNKGEIYDFFLRIVFSDVINIKVLSMLISSILNVKYVQVFYMKDDIGMVEYMKFKEEVVSLGICIVYYFGFFVDLLVLEIMIIVDVVFVKVKIRYVVVLVLEFQVKNFLFEMKNRNLNKFIELIFFGLWNFRVIEGFEVNVYIISF